MILNIIFLSSIPVQNMNANWLILLVLFIFSKVTNSKIAKNQIDNQGKKNYDVKEQNYFKQMRLYKNQKSSQKANKRQYTQSDQEFQKFNNYSSIEDQFYRNQFQQIDKIKQLNQKIDKKQIFQQLFLKNNTLASMLLKNQHLQKIFQSQNGKNKYKNSTKDLSIMKDNQKIDILQNLFNNNKLSSLLKQIQYSQEKASAVLKHRNLQQNSNFKNIWLSKIPNQIQVSQLSIPGTHDTAAYFSPKWYNIFTSIIWKTQSMSIQQQLNKGVRCLDIRVQCQINKNLSLYHGNVYLGQFSKFTDPVKKFLNQNPSQFLIIMFKKQGGDESEEVCGNRIKKQLNISMGNIPQYCYHCKFSVIPTVGQLRGKIWIIQSGGVDFGDYLRISTCCDDRILTDNYQYAVQNYWSGPYSQKRQKILYVIDQPKIMMRINFLSQSILPKYYSNWYNKWFENAVKKLKLKSIGVIMADFVEDSLLQTIIQSNF